MTVHTSQNRQRGSRNDKLATAVVQYSSGGQRDAAVCSYLAAALADNTLRAYRCDLKHFIAWGGTIPASPECVATYVARHALLLSSATLSRRVVAIGRAHSAQGLPSPTTAELVRATLRGIRRKRGSAQRQVAPLQKADVVRLVSGLQGIRGARDKALLLIGFAGAFRRSELVSLDIEDVEFVAEGVVIRLRRSKTDQEGRGRIVAIPYVRGRHCPCRALQAWLQVSGIEIGPLFRGVSRHDRVLPDRLTAQSVALIIKQRAAAVGLDPRRYSGHSLRAGFATSAAQSGAASMSIRAQTGHQSDATLQRYIRNSQLFVDNPNRKVW